MKRIIVVALLATAIAGLVTTAAHASCRSPDPLEQSVEQAPLIFVGTVIGLANDDRTATVTVEEIWKGPRLPVEVRVAGGYDEPGVFTSVDRTFEMGVTYLFFPSTTTEPLEDNACSATQELDSTIEAFRPDVVNSPKPPPGSGSSPLLWAGAAVGLAALVFGGAVLVQRGRTHRHSVQV